MKYNRTLSEEFAKLLKDGGKLRWLFDFVKNHGELDFLNGKNNSEEWISIYRGLSRIIKITKTNDPEIIKIDGASAYRDLSTTLYGKRNINDNFEKEMENVIDQVSINVRFNHLFNNKKEGFHQNIFSRKYGICGDKDDDFVIIDKEVVIGYSGLEKKHRLLGELEFKYRNFLKVISDRNSIRYGSNLGNKPIGNELDFLSLDKEGNIKLIEFKHGSNTSGIYLSAVQIAMYYDIFMSFPREELEKTVVDMLNQKQKIGLINPDWKKPNAIKDIIPVLIISEHNYKSSARKKFDEILQIAREENQLGEKFLENIEAYNFTMENGLQKW